jgi:hypothetical protein
LFRLPQKFPGVPLKVFGNLFLALGGSLPLKGQISGVLGLLRHVQACNEEIPNDRELLACELFVKEVCSPGTSLHFSPVKARSNNSSSITCHASGFCSLQAIAAFGLYHMWLESRFQEAESQGVVSSVKSARMQLQTVTTVCSTKPFSASRGGMGHQSML